MSQSFVHHWERLPLVGLLVAGSEINALMIEQRAMPNAWHNAKYAKYKWEDAEQAVQRLAKQIVEE